MTVTIFIGALLGAMALGIPIAYALLATGVALMWHLDLFDPQILARKGSLYLTRPALADYIADPAEKAELAAEVFGHVAAGRIKIEINQRYALQDAAQAHRDLESRKTTGSSIFVI